MFRKHNVGFPAEGRIEISAWLLVPEGQAAPLSAITTAHGYAGTKYHGLSPLAEAFAESGFVVLLRNHDRASLIQSNRNRPPRRSASRPASAGRNRVDPLSEPPTPA
jgi:cephalosporin-C deacetylase-like acetyl esterase